MPPNVSIAVQVILAFLQHTHLVIHPRLERGMRVKGQLSTAADFHRTPPLHLQPAGFGRRFEQLYANEQTALAGTVANYRATADAARAADRANPRRCRAATINERASNDYGARLAAARLSARRLRLEAATAAAAPALAEQRQCPAYPLPLAELLKEPLKTDFLTPTP